MSFLIMVLFSSNLSLLQAQNAIFRKIEMQEDIKEEAALKVLNFSDDADQAPDHSGNFTAPFIPLDKVLFFATK